MGRTTNNSNVAQYANTTSPNGQWSFPNPVAARLATPLAAQPAAGETTTAPLLYPNPVQDVLHIQLPRGSQATQDRLLNTLGQMLRSVPLSGLDNQVAVRDLPSGLYLLEVGLG